MKSVDLEPWDVDARYSDAALARILRAVVECGGQITDSYVMREQGYKPGQLPVQLRVKLPAGSVDRFREISRAEVYEPPQWDLGDVQ